MAFLRLRIIVHERAKVKYFVRLFRGFPLSSTLVNFLHLTVNYFWGSGWDAVWSSVNQDSLSSPCICTSSAIMGAQKLKSTYSL